MAGWCFMAVVCALQVFDFDLSHMEMVKVSSVEWSGPYLWNPE